MQSHTQPKGPIDRCPPGYRGKLAGQQTRPPESDGGSRPRHAGQMRPLGHVAGPLVGGICWQLVLAVSIVGAGEVGSESPVAWKTGSEFHRAMAATVGVTWSRTPLRPALDRLARRQGVAIFLDRRIDPGQRVDFQAPEMSLRAWVDRLATQLQAEVAILGSVVYLGPLGRLASSNRLPGHAARKPNIFRSVWPLDFRRSVDGIGTSHRCHKT